MPANIMAVTGVGKDYGSRPALFSLATRIAAEMGANYQSIMSIRF